MTTRLQHVRSFTGILVDRTALSGQRALDKMADDCRVIESTAGAVTSDDLELIGWTRPQIEKMGRDAARLATQKSIRRRSYGRTAGCAQ